MKQEALEKLDIDSRLLLHRVALGHEDEGEGGEEKAVLVLLSLVLNPSKFQLLLGQK